MTPRSKAFDELIPIMCILRGIGWGFKDILKKKTPQLINIIKTIIKTK